MSQIKLILVKHSLPVFDPEKPAHQWKLSQEGEKLCIPLAKHIAPYKPLKIFSSQEHKAIQTAGILAQSLGLSSYVIDDLHEHIRPKPGLLSAEQFEEKIKALFSNPDDTVFGSETAAQAQTRFMKAVLNLINQHVDETVAIVSHGTVITLFLQAVSQIEPFLVWKSLGLPSFVILSLPDFWLEKIVPSVNSQIS